VKAAGLSLALVAAACSGTASSPTSDAARIRASGSASSASTLSVPAQRQPLTTDDASPVVHDNEVMALAAHSGRLFAATDQWMYSGPNPAGQVLVKDSGSGPWKVFEQTQSLRVQAIDSFPIPSGQGLGSGHSLLVTQAIVDGRSRVQWLVDRAKSFELGDSYPLPARGGDVRSFGAHESGGAWSVYAGVAPTGILRGTWSPARHTLVFDPTPELTAAPGSQGVPAQKVTGFADCAGALYVSINTNIYRRNDGNLPPRAPRWSLVYQGAPVGAFNSGLRGLSCITHDGSPSLLVSMEGAGDVYRFDHLPRGRLDTDSPGALVPNLEFSPTSAIGQMLTADGTPVPDAGKGSIGYVIAAYNNFEPIDADGVKGQAFGLEWAYRGGCLPGRTCGPTAFGAVTFDAAACFAVRTDHDRLPAYVLRCLGGPRFTSSSAVSSPIRSGQAFVSIRTIQPSPFSDGRIYFGGYDCNFFPADGTAWVGASPLSALHLKDDRKATS
jgi:hypothetical protein